MFPPRGSLPMPVYTLPKVRTIAPNTATITPIQDLARRASPRAIVERMAVMIGEESTRTTLAATLVIVKD
jgi:hypothetical protein